MKFNPQRYFYLLCAVLVLSVAGGGYGYYWASSMLQQRTAEYSQKLADAKLARDKQSDLEALKRRYEEIRPILMGLDSALPTGKKESELSLQLQSLASQSGMSINSITFPATSTGLPGPTSQTIKQGNILAIPVGFELTGSYAQLQSFLQRQERLSRATNVTALTITRVDSKGNLKFSMNLYAFIKPLETQK